jgi:hypothetical protein
VAIDVGQTYRATLAVTDANLTPVNPDAATLVFTTPDQVAHPVTVTLPPAVTGLLTGDFVTSLPGLMKISWQTTNPGVARVDYENVRAYRAAMSLADARDSLGFGAGDHRWDEQIRWALAASTRVAERWVGPLVPRTFTNEIIGGEAPRDILQVQHGPLLSATSIGGVASVWPGGPSWTLAAGDLIVNPAAGTLRLASKLPFWWGPWQIDTYTAGRTEIDEDAERGVAEILWDMWGPHRGQGDDATPPTYEEITATEAEYRPPGRVMALLGPLCRPGFG